MQTSLSTFFKKQGTDTKPAVPASRKRAREEPAEPVQDELDRVLDEEANEETKPQTTTHQTGASTPRKRLRKMKEKEEMKEEAPEGEEPVGLQATEAEERAEAGSVENAAPEKEDVMDEQVKREGAEEEEEHNNLNEEEEAEEEVDSDFDEKEEGVEEQPTIKTTIAKAAATKGKTVKGKSKEVTKGMLALLSSSVDYDPVASAIWKKGEKVPYLWLARTFVEIEQYTARTEIIRLLTNMFRSVVELSPNDLLACVYLTINKIAPSYEGLELGVGESILIKAVASATGKKDSVIKAEYEKLGDLGLVAAAARNTQKTMFPPPPLTVSFVFNTLNQIAKAAGRASQDKKKGLIQQLLVGAREGEAQWLIRSLEGKLRIGLAEKTVQVALAHAIVLTRTDLQDKRARLGLEERMRVAAETLKEVFNELPNYNILIPVILKEEPEKWSESCHLTPGIPVHPMLAHPTKGIDEVLQRCADAAFTCEWKYDGERAQVHFTDDGGVHVYSRNLEDNTTKYPDIKQNLPKAMKPDTHSFILDCEVVAYDREKKQILPFQVLSTRARKDADMSEIKVQICLFGFDLLYFNGQSLVREPFRKRRELLHNAFVEVDDEFKFARYSDANTTDEIANSLHESVAGNCEGLMIKRLDEDATYQPSKRSYSWLKVKKDYLTGMTDSVDLVPIGAYYGKGKRTGVYGAFLLACYDPNAEEFQNVCKIGTGFSDEDLEKFAEFFKDKIISKPRPYYRYSDQVEPDVWFDASVVWEVKAADLSLSPHYKAALGLVSESKGISLRFPRYLRTRDDKKPEDATNGEQIAEMYQQQFANAPPANPRYGAPH